jgi:hypothetical protein
MAGTASVVRDWLLLEHPGPWGVDALRDARDVEDVGEELTRRSRAAGVRVLLIRRFGGTLAGPTTAFAIHTGPERPWIERIELPRFRDAAGIGLERIRGPEPPGLGVPHPRGLFLVCTHGRHDRCCAELGRPLAAAMAEAFPDSTWESSHLGGDRFAGNLVAFPHAYYFGRVTPAGGPAIARAYEQGRLDLEHFRGRSCRPMAVQAAEHRLRVREGLTGIDDVRFEGAAWAPGRVVATFDTGAGRFEVSLDVSWSEPNRLTCRSTHDERAPRYHERSIRRLER